MLFYDTTGQLLARRESHEATLYLLENAEMPMALKLGASKWQVYTAAGKPVAQIPATTEVTNFRVIGTKLYVQEPGDEGENQRWQQWDLRSNDSGPTCHLHLAAPDYVGADGTVAITQTGTWATPTATDTATCQVLWQAPKLSTIWKVGTGLTQANEDGDAISGLRPPD